MNKSLPWLLCLLVSIKLSAQVPVITDFTPKSAEPGSTVIISGTNFNTTPAGNTVYFGATKATITAATATQLTVTVPPGASAKPLSVLVSGLTAFSARTFYPAFRQNKGTLKNNNGFFASNYLSPRKYPSAPAIGDVDGDNYPDLVVSGGAPPGLSTFRNKGTADDLPFETGVEQSSSIGGSLSDLTDVDGDGKKDWMLLSGQTLYVFRNTSTPGALTFAAPVAVSLATTPTRMEVTDLDGDGKADILLNTSGNALLLLKNTGSPGTVLFSNLSISTTFAFKSFKIEDLDNDRKPDIVACNDNTVQVLKNAGTNTFTASTVFTTTEVVRDVSAADMDGDNNPDLVFTTDAFKVNYLRHNADAASLVFDPVLSFRLEFAPDLLSIADLDGDGKPDVAASRFSTGNPLVSAGIGILLNRANNGTLSFENILFYTVGSGGDKITALVIGDFNKDNQPEIILPISGNQPTTSLPLLLNKVPVQPLVYGISPNSGNLNSNITFSGANFSSKTTDNQVQLGAVAAPVLASNGNQLIAKIPPGITHQAFSVSNNARIAYVSQPVWTTYPTSSNLNRSSFQAETSISTALAGNGNVIPADLDSDGKPELIAVTSSGTGILKNNTTGTQLSFSPVTGLPASHIPAAVGDINADGKPDLVTTLSGVINILLNTSTTTAVSFAAPVALTPSPGGSNLTLGDMDGDGRTDIIANSDRASGQVLVYRNTGTGGAVAFTAPAAFSTGTTLDVFVYDLDGDGKMEIITENLSVLQNMSSPGNLIFNSVLSAGNGVFFEQGVSSGIIAADLNADGKPELIAANGVVLPNTSGSGVVSFGTRLNVSVDGNSFYVNVADMDGDGKPDLIFNDPTRTTPGNGTSDDAVSIFRNLSVAGGSLAFDTKLRFVSLGSLRTVIDVNGDGKTDILTRNTGNLLVSLNAILPPVPVITGISPVNGGGPGRTITLTGSSFAELLSISFAGVSQPVYSVSADFTQINLVVPDGATSGDLVVTNRGGSASVPFTAIDPAGFITGSATVCPAQKNLVYSVPPVSGASAYEWTVPSGITVLKGNTTNTLTVSLASGFTGTGNLRVRGIFGTFKGDNSPTFTVTVAVIPATPASLQARIAASGTVALTWADNSNNETEFFIYRAINIDTSFVLLGKVANNLVTYTDNFDLRPGASYFYKIAAANGECLSAFSNTIGIATPPATITAIDPAISDQDLTVSPNPGEGLFEITSAKPLTGKVQLCVLDATGRTLREESWQPSNEKKYLDLTALANGLYFLRIEYGHGTFTKKLIKQ